MKNRKEKGKELNYDKIVIYPLDYDEKKRRRLRKLLDKLGIQFEYAQWVR